jgi:hypothetical protein
MWPKTALVLQQLLLCHLAQSFADDDGYHLPQYADELDPSVIAAFDAVAQNKKKQ